MANQGCPHEGRDHRVFGTVTCWLQRKLSWHSETEPAALTLNIPMPGHSRLIVLVALPPFFAVNVPLPHRLARLAGRDARPGGKRWYWIFRFGARYDRYWPYGDGTGRLGGYIAPEGASKVLDHTVSYGNLLAGGEQ